MSIDQLTPNYIFKHLKKEDKMATKIFKTLVKLSQNNMAPIFFKSFIKTKCLPKKFKASIKTKWLPIKKFNKTFECKFNMCLNMVTK